MDFEVGDPIYYNVNVVHGRSVDIVTQKAQSLVEAKSFDAVIDVFEPEDTWLSIFFAHQDYRSGNVFHLLDEAAQHLDFMVRTSNLWLKCEGHLQMHCYYCGAKVHVQRGIHRNWWKRAVRNHMLICPCR